MSNEQLAVSSGLVLPLAKQIVFIVDKLQNYNALARLAVLFILSAARRLFYF